MSEKIIKYPRTFHLSFSLGASSDDKIIEDDSIFVNKQIVITEKLDGSNFCITNDNCFARSHAGPPTHISFDLAKSWHATVKNKIANNIAIFIEYTFAEHSIFYDKLKTYFNVINVFDIDNDRWLSWNEVESWSKYLDTYTVPVLFKGIIPSVKELKSLVMHEMEKQSCYGNNREGVIIRLYDSFDNDSFCLSCCKVVRANHVTTDQHWKTKQIVRNKIFV